MTPCVKAVETTNTTTSKDLKEPSFVCKDVISGSITNNLIGVHKPQASFERAGSNQTATTVDSSSDTSSFFSDFASSSTRTDSSTTSSPKPHFCRDDCGEALLQCKNDSRKSSQIMATEIAEAVDVALLGGDSSVQIQLEKQREDDDDDDDDGASLGSSGSILSYVGESPFSKPESSEDGEDDDDDGFGDEELSQPGEDNSELAFDDVFHSDIDISSSAKFNSSFTMSFSAKNIPRKNFSKASGIDDSIRVTNARGVPRRGSISKYGYEDASPDLKSSHNEPNLDESRRNFEIDESTRSEPASYYSGRRREALLGHSSCTEGLDGSTRSVPARGVARRSSMKQGQGSRRSTIQFGGEIQVYLPGKNTPVLKRRSISFNKNVVIRPIAPAVELTDRPDELWIQQEELKKIHEMSMELIARRALLSPLPPPLVSSDSGDESGDNAGKNPSDKRNSIQGSLDDDDCYDYRNDCDSDNDSKEDCIRGLEALIEADLKLERKYDAWDSVLNEQDLQRSEGTFDSDDIAYAYQFSTAESSQEALERAKRDEDAVRLYLRGSLHEDRRSSV